jgi:hypothetical protein
MDGLSSGDLVVKTIDHRLAPYEPIRRRRGHE